MYLKYCKTWRIKEIQVKDLYASSSHQKSLSFDPFVPSPNKAGKSHYGLHNIFGGTVNVFELKSLQFFVMKTLLDRRGTKRLKDVVR